MIDLEHQELHRAYLQQRLGCELQPDAQFIANTSPYGVSAFERFTSPENAVFLHGNSFAAARDTYLTSLGAIELQGGYLRIVQRGK